MPIKFKIKDAISLIQKSRITILVLIIFLSATLLAWCESELIISVNSEFTKSFTSDALLSKYQIIKILSLIVSRFLITYLIVFSIFKSSKRLSYYLFNCEISQSVSNEYEDIQDSQSEITASLLLSIRHFVNTVQSSAYLLSSFIFLFLLALNILKLENGIFITFSIIWLILVYFLFLIFNSRILKYYAAKTRFFTKNIIEIVNFLDDSRGLLKGSKSAKNSYLGFFLETQENLTASQINASIFSFLPTLTIESFIYILYVGYFLIGKNPEINSLLSKYAPLVPLLLISSPRLFSLIGKINIYSGLIATSIPHLEAIINADKRSFNTKKYIKSNENNLDTISSDNPNELIVSTLRPNLKVLKIKKNSISILEGKSGSGKSSLILNLINNRNCDFNSSYYLDLYEKGKLYCFMSSKNSFFEGNILENITMKQKSYNEEKLFKALNISGFNKITKLSKKGQRDVIYFLKTESISSLSSGEQQRVAISRSILCGGQVLLFDEATSNLPISEHKRIVYNLVYSNLFDSFLFCSHHSNKFFEDEIKKNITIYSLDD